jgi:signal peptidase II
LKRTHIVFLILFSVLLIDQALKIYIKTNFYYGESVKIAGLEWAQLHFIENEGMAFGITFGNKCIGVKTETGCTGIMLSPEGGKIILSLFRLIMVAFLCYLLAELVRLKESKGLIICFSLILAGAIGNIIDSAFYGVIFSDSLIHTREIAEIFPENGGYSNFLYGKVVDMFYFPLIDTYLPQWLPFWGGDRFEFFRPVFNVADSSISVGVAAIIIFYHKFLLKGNSAKEG